MEIKFDYCCKKLREFLTGNHDVCFDIEKRKFYWENHDYDENFEMDYCPFCGEKIGK